MTRSEALETIKTQLDCRHYLTKSKGRQYACPFCGSGQHKNGTGALTLYDTNTFTCFSCGKSGDVIDLIKERYGTDYNGALNIAAQDIGITIDRYTNDSNRISKTEFSEPIKKRAETFRSETEDVAETEIVDITEYCRACADALHNSPAISYLLARGISEETATAYNLGYDAESDIAQRGYKTPSVIIPVNSSHYIARRIDGKSEYKAMNNKGCVPSVFNTKALYAGSESVFIVEGWADAISVELCGGSAVALNSTNFTGKLIKQLEHKPASATMIICLDNDDAGKNATERLKSDFERLSIPYIVADITGRYKDANEALVADKEELKRMVYIAMDNAKNAKIEALNEDITEQKQSDIGLFLEKIQTEAYKPHETGLKWFDRLLGGGIADQSLLLLLAAPATGKTTLCQQLASEIARRKKQILYINLEMSKEQMLAKDISRRVSIKGTPKTATEIMRGYEWSEQDRAVITSDLSEYESTIYPYLKYIGGNGSSIESIMKMLEETAQKAQANGNKAPAVVVDYLHLLTSDKGMETQELIKTSVKHLKDYAIKYNTFVVLIVATNRASNSSGRLTMESGRDSSSIEYTGDYQLALNYYDIDNGEVKPTETDKLANLQKEPYRRMVLRVLKNRFGMNGNSENIYYDSAHNIFYGDNDFMPACAERVPFEAEKEPRKHLNKRV